MLSPSLSEDEARINPLGLEAVIERDRRPFLLEIHTRDRTRQFPSSEMVPGREAPGLAVARQIAGFGVRLSEQQR
jgi:hypothetical protein